MATWSELPFAPLQALAIGIALTAGLVRGLTGFGGAMVMTPPLALLFGPQQAVPVVLLLEAFAGASMLPDASRRASWSVLTPIGLAACAAVPIGGWVLAHADQLWLRRGIAATVVVFALLLLRGVRHRGGHGVGPSVALGTFSGTLLGATGMGGPPVILYLLSGPDPVAVTRANMTLYVVLISAAGLVMLVSRGLLGLPGAAQALLLAPGFALGVWVGGRWFQHTSDERFRRITLWLLMVLSALIVLA